MNDLEASVIYISSQIFTVVNYGLLILSYQLKNHTKILLINLLSLFCIGVAYFLLDGKSGLAMTIIAILRNIIFYFNKKINVNNIAISTIDILSLIFLYVLAIICAVETYESLWGLTSLFTFILYTYSIWQKNTKIYKIIGIPVCICALLYNIYIKSIFGIILESILIISAIVGFLREYNDSKNKIKTHYLK